MKSSLWLLLLITITKANDEATLVINKELVSESNLKLTSEHDVINIIVPINKNLFRENEDEISYLDDINDTLNIFFFIVGDSVQGVKYQGLYIYKNGETVKILKNGRDVTAFNNERKSYLGASDGIYVYDYKNGTIYKYGSLTDKIIQVEANQQTGVLYFVTDDHQVFSVSEEGTKKTKVDINDVEQIVFDFNDNLYYYDNKKDVYISNQDGVKKIDGIPKGRKMKLIRPAADQNGVFAVVDEALYLLNVNRSADRSNVTLEVNPSAYSCESVLIHYYALDKKIYEFNAELVVNSISSEVKNYVSNHYNDVQVLLRSLEIVSGRIKKNND